MYKPVKRKVRRLSDWDVAIAEAQKLLIQTQRRAIELRTVIDNFKKLKRSGIPWPLSNT